MIAHSPLSQTRQSAALPTQRGAAFFSTLVQQHATKTMSTSTMLPSFTRPVSTMRTAATQTDPPEVPKPITSPSSVPVPPAIVDDPCQVCQHYKRTTPSVRSCPQCPTLRMCEVHAESHFFHYPRHLAAVRAKSIGESPAGSEAARGIDPDAVSEHMTLILKIADFVDQFNSLESGFRTRLSCFLRNEPILVHDVFYASKTKGFELVWQLLQSPTTSQTSLIATISQCFTLLHVEKSNLNPDEAFFNSQSQLLVHIFQHLVIQDSQFTSATIDSILALKLERALQNVASMSCSYWFRDQDPFELEPSQLKPKHNLQTLISNIQSRKYTNALQFMLQARHMLLEFALDSDSAPEQNRRVKQLIKLRREDAHILLIMLYRELNSIFDTQYDFLLTHSSFEELRIQSLLNVDAVAQLRVAAAEMAVKQSADLKPLASKLKVRDICDVLSAYRDANPSAEAKLKIFVNPQSNEVKNDRERGEADREPFEQIMTIVNKMEPASVVALVYRILQRTSKDDFRDQIWRDEFRSVEFVLLVCALTLREVDPTLTSKHKISFFSKFNERQNAASLVFENGFYTKDIIHTVLELWASRCVNTYLIKPNLENSFFEFVDSQRALLTFRNVSGRGSRLSYQNMNNECINTRSIDEVIDANSPIAPLRLKAMTRVDEPGQLTKNEFTKSGTLPSQSSSPAHPPKVNLYHSKISNIALSAANSPPKQASTQSTQSSAVTSPSSSQLQSQLIMSSNLQQAVSDNTARTVERARKQGADRNVSKRMETISNAIAKAESQSPPTNPSSPTKLLNIQAAAQDSLVSQIDLTTGALKAVMSSVASSLAASPHGSPADARKRVFSLIDSTSPSPAKRKANGAFSGSPDEPIMLDDD